MSYEKPKVLDLGELKDLTQASGQIGSPDGIGFTIQVNAGDVAEVSVGVLP
jgi:hypothetical protein